MKTLKDKALKEKIEMWIDECDVDGRKISFEFFDTDANDLRNLFAKSIQELKKEFEVWKYKPKVFELDNETEKENLSIESLKRIIDKIMGDFSQDNHSPQNNSELGKSKESVNLHEDTEPEDNSILAKGRTSGSNSKGCEDCMILHSPSKCPKCQKEDEK